MAQVVNKSLALLPVFVPGALTIETGTIISVFGQVPSLDLSSVYPSNALNMNNFLDYLEPSGLFKQVIRSAATTNVASGWDAPEGECSSASSCSYTFHYTAPALRCIDLSSGDIGNGTDPNNGQTVAIDLNLWEWSSTSNFVVTYNATSNLNRTISPFTGVWEETYLYNLIVACNPHFGYYNPLAPQNSELTPVGSSCVFWNATYSATTTFANNSQTTSAQILSYNSPLSPSNCTIDACFTDWDAGTTALSPDSNFALASRAMAETFVDLFLGNLTFYGHTGTFLDEGDTTSAQYTPLFSINNTLDLWSFDMTAPNGNLSQGLTDLFTNTTLAFISIASNLTDPLSPTTPTALAEMVVQPSYSQYNYVQWKLFLIYGIALLAVCVAAVYGLWCIKVDVHPTNMDFSEMVAATRHEDVDLALKGKDDVGLQYCWDHESPTGGSSTLR